MKMTNNAPLYWYVFYNDQLLLQKKAVAMQSLL